MNAANFGKTFAYTEGFHRYEDWLKNECSNLDNPYCIEDSRYKQFADGITAAYEEHQASLCN